MLVRKTQMLTRIWIGALAPLVLYVILRLDKPMDRQVGTPAGHFYIVSIVSILAMVIAVAAGISATRLRNIKVTFVSLAFISLSEVFAVHGLSTPDFLLKPTHLPDVAAQLAVTLTAIWLWLSSASSDRPIVVFLSRHQKLLVPTWLGLLTIGGAIALANPDLIDWIPLDRNPLKWPILAITLLLTLPGARRYWVSYRYSRFPFQLAVTYSMLWLAGAQIIMTTGEMWHISWWIYHFLLLFATLVTIVGILQQYATGESLGDTVHGLFSADPVARLEDGISPSIRALVIATEARDTYTAGHNFRVAFYAVRIAEEMGLNPKEVRMLAQGSIVHDVGKIQVPDSILNKPGALTPEERSVIERHPVTGYEMCKRLGFMNEELGVIRHHHERWDGEGYPDGLKEEGIPLLARILAVADVYDALTSSRSYRQAWSHEDAMQFLNNQAGIQFDSTCVEAWNHVSEMGLQMERFPSWSLLEPQPGVLPV
jgi:putative nucleotidyltransferase with HDIG domain